MNEVDKARLGAKLKELGWEEDDISGYYRPPGQLLRNADSFVYPAHVAKQIQNLLGKEIPDDN